MWQDEDEAEEEGEGQSSTLEGTEGHEVKMTNQILTVVQSSNDDQQQVVDGVRADW